MSIKLSLYIYIVYSNAVATKFIIIYSLVFSLSLSLNLVVTKIMLAFPYSARSRIYR